MVMKDFIYIKRSLGKGGRQIDIYKIRTMRPSHEETYPEPDNMDQYGKPVENRRVTQVGKFLRRYWIDELPQIWNLVRGDIRIVGVRPMGAEVWDYFPKDVREEALKNRPGLFGFQYAFAEDGDFETHIEWMRQYLKEMRERPYSTDLKYMSRILINIFFRGVRSS